MCIYTYTHYVSMGLCVPYMCTCILYVYMSMCTIYVHMYIICLYVYVYNICAHVYYMSICLCVCVSTCLCFCVSICLCVCVSMCLCVCISMSEAAGRAGARYSMEWLRLVGSFKLYVSFAEYSLFHRSLLEKRLMILRSLLIEATPYWGCGAHRS